MNSGEKVEGILIKRWHIEVGVGGLLGLIVILILIIYCCRKKAEKNEIKPDVESPGRIELENKSKESKEVEQI